MWGKGLFITIAELLYVQHIPVDIWPYRYIILLYSGDIYKMSLLNNDVVGGLLCNKLRVVKSEFPDYYLYQVDCQPEQNRWNFQQRFKWTCDLMHSFLILLTMTFNTDECCMALFVTNLCCIGSTLCIFHWFCRKWDGC